MRIKIQKARLAFADLWEARSGGPGWPARFSATLLVAPDYSDVTILVDREDGNGWVSGSLTAAMVEVAQAEWGADKGKQIVADLLAAGRTCLRNGDKSYDGNPAKSEKYESFAGRLFITTSSKTRVTVVDADAKTPLAEQDGKPYPGSYVTGIFDVWAQDGKNGRRINAGLQGLQFIKDGDAFLTGHVASKSDFDDVSVNASENAGWKGEGDDLAT